MGKLLSMTIKSLIQLCHPVGAKSPVSGITTFSEFVMALFIGETLISSLVLHYLSIIRILYQKYILHAEIGTQFSVWKQSAQCNIRVSRVSKLLIVMITARLQASFYDYSIDKTKIIIFLLNWSTLINYH